MIENEFFSDDSVSDNESVTSYTDNNDYTSRNFSNVYENKHVETIKFLRLTLKENKILKRRLNMIENELDFKSILPTIDQTQKFKVEEKKRSKSIESAESIINEDFLITTDDKECQTDSIEIIADKEMISEKIFNENSELAGFIQSVDSLTQITEMNLKDREEDSELEIYQMPEILKLDKACQYEKEEDEEEIKFKEVETFSVETTESINDQNIQLPYSEEAIEALKFDQKNLRAEKEELNLQIEALNQKVLDLKLNNKNLLEKYDSMISSHELTNGLLEEARIQLFELKEKSNELEELKLNYDDLLVTNEGMNKKTEVLEIQINEKKEQIFKLNEKIAVLSGNFEIMEEQSKKIDFLEAECERHLNEKHIKCEKRINELTTECQNNVGFIAAQKNELNILYSQVEDLNKQMEKNKIELQSFNFKEFIVLKRELAQLKQEKEKQFALKQQHKEVKALSVEQPLPLPPIKENNQKKTSFKFLH